MTTEASVPAALLAYEEDRKARTAKYQNLAARLGGMGQWSAPHKVFIRNNMMRIMYRTVALKSHKEDMAFVA